MNVTPYGHLPRGGWRPRWGRKSGNDNVNTIPPLGVELEIEPRSVPGEDPFDVPQEIDISPIPRPTNDLGDERADILSSVIRPVVAAPTDLEQAPRRRPVVTGAGARPPRPRPGYLSYEERAKTVDAALLCLRHARIGALVSRDGSLCDGGVEIRTQPRTLDLHRQGWMKALPRLQPQWKSHDSPRCGLHVHIPEPPPEDEWRLLIWASGCAWPHLVKLSRRSEDNFQRWAGGTLTNLEQGIARYKSIAAARGGLLRPTAGGKYSAFNPHQGTLEIRIFKGTVKPESFFAALEFAESMYHFGYFLRRYPLSMMWSVARSQEDTWGMYTHFLRLNGMTRWPCLYRYMQVRGVPLPRLQTSSEEMMKRFRFWVPQEVAEERSVGKAGYRRRALECATSRS